MDPVPVDTTGLRMPLQLDGSDAVDPGWEVDPHHLEGIFLAPVESDGALAFTPIDSDGTALWTARRPLACAGFTLTLGADGAPLAVLNDSTPTADALSATTATAYDLRTGERVWGPVDVPGPHQGPGLVYASPPAEAMGETGPRLALDAASGRVIADERDGTARVVAERHGTVVLQEGDQLRATEGDRVLWEIPVPEGVDRAQSPPGQSLAGAMLALRTADERSTIVDLTTGAVVATDVTSAAWDATTGTLVATDGTRAWAVDAQTGETSWDVPASPDARIVSAGGAQAYLRDGDTIHVHNTLTGAANPGYEPAMEGTIAVPRAIATTGAATFAHEGGVLLATTPTLP
ncbi:outer membrane protein assembly factor BamB family protein [Demequina muriae]|uniref:Pyrrolo-quinoline quinone repeat domain-containing protein n=1 Tax=Demequina muriae TaxID=3051664 RepID=A0ABT8GDJ6_9MICO|nr:PQQ-binding-like beta-propeller repeat protein [Demequina sp. EGI L300058]MDN4479504.1 hypothetical protein [Demequina sp. EGI L300058]